MTAERPALASRGRRGLRLPWRWLFLLAAVALAWPLRTEGSTSVVLPALSPFIAVAASISVRTAGVLALLAAPVLLLGLASPRWFCRQGCPVGLLQELVERYRPTSPRPWLKWPAAGPWLVFLTLGGAALGYPLFLWLDPLALFNAFLNAWRQPWSAVALLSGLGLPLLLLLDAALPRFWCQRVCPLGATQDLLAWTRSALRGTARCLDPGQEGAGFAPNPARRWFLAACLGATGAFALRAGRGQTPPLRPPGAIDDRRFPGLCVRCGNCAQACPSRIIQPDWGSGGLEACLTPRLRFDRDYCREDCHRCNQVCPSGALARLSLVEKRRHRIGRVRVVPETCLLAQGRECTACIRKCPYEALVIRSADGGFSNQPAVLTDRCNGCGACEAVCPTQPVRSISVRAD